MVTTPPPDRASSLRVDAERNRRDIVTAAQEVFAQRGIAVPLNEVARRAGVGIATLYRRFPNRDALIAEAFDAKITGYADAADAALADPDPWLGFVGFLERAVQMQATDRGFREVMTMSFPTAKHFEAERKRAYAGFVTLIARAKAVGRLREDFVPEDLILLLMANAGVLVASGRSGAKASARLVEYLVQSFSSARGTLPAPLSAAESFAALLRLQTGDAPASPSESR